MWCVFAFSGGIAIGVVIGIALAIFIPPLVSIKES